MQKKLVVLGAGESGTGTAVLAKKKGFEVFVTDKGRIKQKYKDVLSHIGVEWEEEKHSEEKILNADVVVKSPGIPEKNPLVKKLLELKILVISEIEFAGRYTNAKTICITGSNGKTTTTMLTYHILKKAGLNVGLAGNVGKSFAWQVAEENFDYYVLELSSFQLDGMFEFRADIAILLNITPDHLDRYDYKMENYVNSKFRIIQNQTENEHFIYCADDEVTADEVAKRNIKSILHPYSITKKVENGAYLENDEININLKNNQLTMSVYQLALQGKHNVFNSMASGIASRILEVRKEVVRESFADFQNVEHRLEYVTTVCGIKFINDSKATNVNSVWYALESIDKPIVWIVGGVDKGNDYSSLIPIVKDKVKAIVCLGTDNSIPLAQFGNLDIPTFEAKGMYEAVQTAYRAGKKGDTILLSPACASFDLFENFEDRGRQFKEFARAL